MGGFFAFGEIKMMLFTVVEPFGMLRFVYTLPAIFMVERGRDSKAIS